jgi:hypothetical protein
MSQCGDSAPDSGVEKIVFAKFAPAYRGPVRDRTDGQLQLLHVGRGQRHEGECIISWRLDASVK